ncbi:MAG: SIS domain-containing protein [Patescibacteria group bacterium]|nr:SIS domain-containing protein [Patescibacteria group bacterium]
MDNYIDSYFEEVKKIADNIDKSSIKKVIDILKNIRSNSGRLYIIGVGGSAGSASHAVNDFRKLAGIEAYAPTDNVSELTARTNDEGWQTIFSEWLKGSKLNNNDVILVLSVGGGNEEKNISPNIVEALKLAKDVGAKIIGIVSRDGGYTKKVADACVLIPVVNDKAITPHAESFQAVVWHLIVFHPDFQLNSGKWESIKK